MNQQLVRSVIIVSSSILVCALGFSCTPEAQTCSSFCTGCCDSSGACQRGDSTAACGSTGLACVACAGGQTCLAGTCITTGGGTGQDAGTDAGQDGGTDAGVACQPVSVSVCGNTSSLIRGVVRLDPEVTPTAGTSGDLLIVLTHKALGEADTGGVYHTLLPIPSVNLASANVPFTLDMCNGGEMWSEENGAFNLIVILDTNGNNDPTNPNFTWIPDLGEASIRAELPISCHTPSPCLDVKLSCVAGQSCIAFNQPPGCGCTQPACNSPINACCP